MSTVVNDGLTTGHAEYARACAGIRRPEIVTLPAGQTIFRFASTERIVNGKKLPTNSADWANGPWWMREDDYRKIIAQFMNSKLSLGTIARSAVAVQPSWSLVDVSIKAHIHHDMNVFSGVGAPQFNDILPNGMRMTLPGWSNITQLYIPNMRSTARSNIIVQRQKKISSHSFGW